MLVVRHCMVIHPTTSMTMMQLTLKSHLSPAPSLHDIHVPACCIVLDHSIRKGDPPCSQAVVVVVAVVCGMAAAMVMVQHGVVIVAMAYMQ